MHCGRRKRVMVCSCLRVPMRVLLVGRCLLVLLLLLVIRVCAPLCFLGCGCWPTCLCTACCSPRGESSCSVASDAAYTTG